MGIRLRDNAEVRYDSVNNQTIIENLDTGDTIEFDGQLKVNGVKVGRSKEKVQELTLLHNYAYSGGLAGDNNTV